MLNAALLLSVLGVVAAWGQGHIISGNRGRRRSAGALAAVDFSQRYARHRRKRDRASPLRAQEHTGNVRHRGVYQARQRTRRTRPCATPSARALGPRIWSTF